MSKKRRLQDLLASVDQAKRESTASATEVLEHLHKALLAIPPFELRDGTKARLDPYIAPQSGQDGQMTCGIDVLLDNGVHLEFTMTNTGWGKAFQPEFGRFDSGRER